MVATIGLTGLRPDPARAPNIASPPYDVIKPGTPLEKLLSEQASSLFHIILGDTPAEARDRMVADGSLIEDDEPGQPGEFELKNLGDNEVSEDAGSVRFEVNRLNGDTGPVTVDYGTVDGVGDDGAKAGSHYVASTGRLLFEDGQTTRSFEVPIIDDDEPGPQKRPFEVVITNPTLLSTLEPGSNKVTIRILENDGVTDGGGDSDCLGWCCFVATAAYGSYLDPHVEVLRDFRDRHLQRYSAGRAFTAWYYRNSPPLAAYIAERPAARWLARAALTPVVYTVAYPGVTASVLALSALLLLRRRRRKSVGG